MTDLSNAEFYAWRQQQALRLAENATLPEVRSIHLRMADAYAARVGGDPAQPQTLRLVHP